MRPWPATTTLSIPTHNSSLEQPAKYRISWTSGQKWLSYKKPNPGHLRRGNIFVDADKDGFTDVSIKIFVPPDDDSSNNVLSKTFRLRVRPIYADKTRGHDRIVSATVPTANHGGFMIIADGW